MTAIRTGYVRRTDGKTATLEPSDRRGTRRGPSFEVWVPDDLSSDVLAAFQNRDYACFTVDESVLAAIENLRL